MNKDAYNKYKCLPNFSYNIIEKLMTDEKAELLWKLIKYNDVDAYDKPNVSQEEKSKLIYQGKGAQDDYSVFLDYMSTDTNYKVKTIMRIYPSETIPTNRTVGIQTINIEVYVEETINHLSNYTTRVDNIIQILLEILNGANVGGLGQMFFDYDVCRYCRVGLVGTSPYKGKILVLAVNVG